MWGAISTQKSKDGETQYCFSSPLSVLTWLLLNMAITGLRSNGFMYHIIKIEISPFSNSAGSFCF